jgi:hypothetical protein
MRFMCHPQLEHSEVERSIAASKHNVYDCSHRFFLPIGKICCTPLRITMMTKNKVINKIFG